MAKYGWGECSWCGTDVCITKNGLAFRHGYIRVRRGRTIVGFGGKKINPPFEGGRDHHPCKGSGKRVINAYFKDGTLQERYSQTQTAGKT